MAWVYILRGASGRYYIGASDNKERRISEHRRGSNHTTKRFGGSIELVASREVESMKEARAMERSLKKKKNPVLAIKILEGE